MNTTDESMTPNSFDLSNDLKNAIIFNNRRRTTREIRENNVHFSILQSKKYYNIILFYIGSQIAKKAKIDEGNIRLKFGCNKDNNSIWYLFADRDGCLLKKRQNQYLYFISMIFPFNFIDKQMQFITYDNILIDSDRKILKFDVSEILKEKLEINKKIRTYNGCKKLNSGQLELLKQRVANGEKKSLIANEFGISRETLYHYLQTLNILY